MAGQTNRWLLGARPKTLPASVLPVIMGTAVAASDGELVWWRAIAALSVALALQVGVNYANDYSDGVRGTDETRVGPKRLVASGLARPHEVRRGAIAAFAVAAVIGTVLSLAVQPLLIVAIGLPSLLAAWFYTGGPRPYGYTGFGEVAVFVFFGLIATLGSQYVHDETLSWLGVGAAVCAGCLSMALLVVNNLRDIKGDAAAGKRTLAVRIGDSTTRTLFIGALVLPFAICVAIALARPLVAIVVFGIPFAVVPIRNVLRGDTGRNLVASLAATARVQLVFGLLFSLGVVL